MRARAGRVAGAGGGGVGRELRADGLQVRGQAGRGARAAGDRDGHAREDVVGAGGGEGEHAAERGGGGVAGGQRGQAPALLDGREDRRVVERGGTGGHPVDGARRDQRRDEHGRHPDAEAVEGEVVGRLDRTVGRGGV